MAFTLGGLFIKAQIENGEKTFGLSANNAFVNSIESIGIKMSIGGVSEISLSITPTFPQAVDIIESGILGYGFPSDSEKGNTSVADIAGGVVSQLPGSPKSTNNAVNLAVQVGYTDNDPAMGTKQRTPWIYAMITAPDISFGQEIKATVNATSATYRTLLDTCKDRKFPKKSLKEILEQVIKEDCDGYVEYLDSDVETELSQKIVSVNQDDNSLAFIKKLLEKHGFYYYLSGGDNEFARETMYVATIKAQNSKKPLVTLRMYGQIDVNNSIYPIEEFNTNIVHAMVTGSAKKSEVKSLNTETKESSKKTFSAKEHGDKNKVLGKTASLDDGTGRPTEGKVASGFPTPDEEKSNKKFIGLAKEENDIDSETAVESESSFNNQNAFFTTVKSVFIPEAIPGSIVNVEIFTGNPDRPLFTKVSGIYKVMSVEHTIGTSGGSSTLQLVREIGSIVSELKTQTVKVQKPKPVTVEPQPFVLNGGMYSASQIA